MLRVSLAFARLAAIALFATLAGSVGAQGMPATGEDVPARLEPPADSVLLFELGARGVQIYACEAEPDNATTYVWTFKAPEAELLNARGEVVGSHYAGPTWEVLDGSTVVAAVVDRAGAPDPDAIPWLLLVAKERASNGVFSMITHIQRLATVGGIAPSAGCDGDHVGEVARVPYEATYAFFYPFYPSELA